MTRTAILGATGFLGSHITRALIEAGHEVMAVVRPGGDTRRLAGLHGGLVVVPGSLETIAELRQPFERFRPETLVHLAWHGVGNTERNSPLQAANVASAVQLAELAADLGVGAFIGAGSQAEYGPYDRPIRETDETRPTTLYGTAKLAACQAVGTICADRGVRFAWLRIFSTYGPMDNEGWLIPSMIRRLRRGERVSLTGCEQRWSFLHARDAATAFRTVIERGNEAQGLFNLGHPDAPPLARTVACLRDLIDPHAELGFGEIPYRPDQVMVLQPDITRLRRLGWEPSLSLEMGLRETVEWYAGTDN